MKKLLTPLTLLFLVACQPSELDRCIEANNNFIGGYEKFMDNASKYRDAYEMPDSLTEINYCMVDNYSDPNSKFYNADAGDVYRALPYCENKIKEQYQKQAQLECHAQGIY